MSYISLIWALFNTPGTLTGNAWWDAFLNQLVIAETWFYHASWWIWGIALFIAIVFSIVAFVGGKKEGVSAGIGCGCLMIILLTLPFWEWITLLLAKNMAASVDPAGVVNQGRLIVSAL